MIIRSVHTSRYIRGQHTDGVQQTGLDLYMSDGSVWFHPYDGSAPRQVT